MSRTTTTSGKGRRFRLRLRLLAVLLGVAPGTAFGVGDLVNFETPTVHPLDLSPDSGAEEPAPLPRAFVDRLEDRRQDLIGLRRDLHRHPELSGREERTAGIVARRLTTLGFEVETGIGGYGVVGFLRGERSGPIVAFRADMDAVASTAPDPVEFRSLSPGVRHICGHDLHTTVALALAEGFAAIRSDLAGNLLLVFQPAEETGTGARAMLADGLFDAATPDALFAFHTVPMPVGTVATAEGALMAWRDRVEVTISGSGDLDRAASEVRRALVRVGTVAPEEAAAAAPRDAILARVGSAQQGADGSRVVPATLSTANPETGRLVREALARIELERITLRTDYQEKWLAGVANDPALARRAAAVARSLLGDEAVFLLTRINPAFSEDFGSLQAVVPGVMFFLGVSNAEKGWIGMPHSPAYVADEEAIFVGARVMGAVLLDRLRKDQAADRPSSRTTER